MRPLVRPYTDPAGGQWYVASAHYPTDNLGSAAYQFVMANMARGDLGVFRHGLPGEEGRNVTAVSPDRAEVLRVSRLLGKRGGADIEHHSGVIERMVMRRARFVVEARQRDAKAGRYKIKHPGRGAVLNADGSMSDDIPGQG